MTRLAVAILTLAAAGCGQAPQDATPPVDNPDADAEVDAPPDADAAEAEPDAPPRCPPVEPASLQATFTEKRIAAGRLHTCGIRDDGTVACWGGGLGGEYYGSTVPPAGTFVRLAAGYEHTCGIRTDGEVECWGAGKTFEPAGDDCSAPECGQSDPLPGQFVEIAAGALFTCGLRPDFTIECWGWNENGIEPPCGQFVQMSGWGGACAVDSEGHVECWPAWPEYGGGVGKIQPRAQVKQVSRGDSCDCFLYTSGEADCWLALFVNGPYPGRQWIETWSPKGVAAVSCGDSHACAILEDGTVACYESSGDPWGGPPGMIPGAGPPPAGEFSEISCGQSFCCGLRIDGTAACWGNGYGADMPPDFPGGS